MVTKPFHVYKCAKVNGLPLFEQEQGFGMSRLTSRFDPDALFA